MDGDYWMMDAPRVRGVYHGTGKSNRDELELGCSGEAGAPRAGRDGKRGKGS